MRLIGLAVILILGLSLAPLAVEAQEFKAREVHRIGYLGTFVLSLRNVEAFREGLRERGWIEGRNTIIEWRFSEGRAERLSDLAAELVRSRWTSSSRVQHARPLPQNRRPRQSPSSAS